MAQLHIKDQQKPLRVAYQSEILALRKEVAELKLRIASMHLSEVENINKTEGSGKMKVPTANGYTFIEINSILYGEACSNYSKLFVQDHGKITSYLISQPLKSICVSLPASTFFRCHQSYVVNTKTIQSYSYDNGMHLQLNDDVIIPVSRRNKKDALDILQRL